VGSVFGHEFTGIVEAVGPSVRNLKVGDHVLVPFNIFCGSCYFCERELYGNCDNTNPEATAVGGIYGYSHTAGGYDGGQAEYVRVPFADVGPMVIPPDIDIEDAVLLTDALPTGYQAAEMGDIRKGDTVVVFGAGPVGLKAHLAPFMPVPVVEKKGKRFVLNYNLPSSVGKVRAFYGHFAALVRAYAYIRSLGPSGLRRVAEVSVINANYLMTQLKGHYHLPYDKFCKHECVFSDARQIPHESIPWTLPSG